MTPRDYEKLVARFLLRRLRGKKRSIESRGGPAFSDNTGTAGDPPPTFYGAPGLGNPIKWNDPDPPGGPKVGSGDPIKWNQPDPGGGPGVGSGNPNQWVPPDPGGPKVGSGGVIKYVPPDPGGPKVGPGGPTKPNSWIPPDPNGGPVVGSGSPIKVDIDFDPKPGPLAPSQWVPPYIPPGGPAAGVGQAPWQQWVITDGQGGDGDASMYDQLFVQRRAFWDKTESWPATAISSSTWIVQLGTWSIASPIVSNTVFDAGTLKGLLIYGAQQSYYDVRIAAILRNPVAASAHAVAARMTFAGGQWSGYYGVAANTTYTLFRLDAGVATSIATSVGAAVANGDTLTLTIKGTAITLSATGLGAALNATDATYAYGAVGLANAINRQADFDTTTITDRPN